MNTKEIKESFLFHYHEKDTDKFFCPCGTDFTVKKSIEEKEFVLNTKDNSPYGQINIEDVIDKIELNASCPNCKKQIKEFSSMGRKAEVNKRFYKNFSFNENASEIKLSKSLIEGEYDAYFDTFSIKETKVSLLFEKESKQIKFIHNDNVTDIDLDTLFDTVSKFYFTEKEKETVKIVDNLVDIHIFIGRLANFIKDAKNIDFLSGLMEEINGTRNGALNDAIPALTKVTCILLAIAKHESLSTVALTKNALFLFELLKDCELPKSNTLTEQKITKPVQIFSYLINLESKKVQEDIDKENNEKQKVLHRSVRLLTGEELTFSNDFNSATTKTKGIKKAKDGTLVLEDDMTNKQISPLIYKKIKTVKEYKKLIRYTKFIDYNYLVNLTKKYEIDFLNELFVYLEYRGDLNINRLNYFLNLYSDYKNSSSAFDFHFSHYIGTFDDSLRMIHALKWDINKHLLNIKKCDELEKYHDWLVKHYNMTQQKESNVKYQNFVEKYKEIENYNSKDIRIKLIGTIESLMFWAKELNNCAASYATRVLNQQYLLAIVEYKTFKEDEDGKNLKNFMMGFSVDKRGMLEFDQIKSTNNQRGSNKFKMLIMEFLREKDITFREVADLSINFDSKNFSMLNGIMGNLNQHAQAQNVAHVQVDVNIENGQLNFQPYLMAEPINNQPEIQEPAEPRKVEFNPESFVSPGVSTRELEQNQEEENRTFFERMGDVFNTFIGRRGI
jgi:hypothetical protein